MNKLTYFYIIHMASILCAFVDTFNFVFLESPALQNLCDLSKCPLPPGRPFSVLQTVNTLSRAYGTSESPCCTFFLFSGLTDAHSEVTEVL